ncbi:MAG: hypothetical protein K6T94_05390 [Paenibacillus sp.]|nr:hypothetical protein [Paenibacillus sp.]
MDSGKQALRERNVATIAVVSKFPDWNRSSVEIWKQRRTLTLLRNRSVLSAAVSALTSTPSSTPISTPTSTSWSERNVKRK